MQENIKKLLSNSKLEFIYRDNNTEIWENILKRCKYIPIEYQNETLDFQIEFILGNNTDIFDLSIIILNDKTPIAVWPLAYNEFNYKKSLNSFGSNLLSPLFISDTLTSVKKKIIKECIDIIKSLNSLVTDDSLIADDIFINNREISTWHYELIRSGAYPQIKYELFVDLSQNIELIKSNFRKSYKSLINNGLKIWKIGILINDGREVWYEFKKLHFEVAGKKTRSDKTWEIHYNLLINGKAFLVYLRDDFGKMIGAGFFQTSKSECLYAVAAYDRGLFDKPIGHIVQYVAIKEMKRRNILWYKIGQRHFLSDSSKPSQKEVSISEFKEGFSTHVFPRYVIKF